ncbi:phosphomannomutase, partial [candidate division WOR-3 bacterium 4484_100]
MNQAIFREYDIRGLADKDLNDNDVYLLGRALGTYFQNSNTVVVGQDVRLSSPRIFKSLTRGINDSGCDVVDIGVVPTPGLYFSLFYYDIGNGVMITASHNPKEFNGFKICHNKGTIYGQEIQKLRRLAEEKKFSSGHGKIIKKQIEEDYINYLLKDINIDNKLKVAVDTGNGTCGPIVEKILQRLHIEHHILYKEPDGNFPGHLPDPVVVKYIQELIVLVKKGNFSAGLGFDGDGDRLGVVDENGDIIWGDVLLAIYAQELLQRMPGAKIIFEVKCSRGLIERIEELGGIPLMFKTGHSLIKAKMKQEKAPLAGEMSGHIFFADRYFGFDDALYASLRLLEILSQGKKLSELA